MLIKRVILFLSAIPLIFCVDLENYVCYYDIFSNETDPEVVDFYNRVEQLIQGIGINDSLSKILPTGEQLLIGTVLFLDRNVTQALLVPDSQVLSSVGSNNSVSKRQLSVDQQTKYSTELQRVLEKLTDTFHNNCEGGILLMNKGGSESCNETLSDFMDGAVNAYVESIVTADGGLKLNLIKILIDDEDECYEDSSNKPDTQDESKARRKRDVGSRQMIRYSKV